MYKQKQKEMKKAFEKQRKELSSLKQGGLSSQQAKTKVAKTASKMKKGKGKHEEEVHI